MKGSLFHTIFRITRWLVLLAIVVVCLTAWLLLRNEEARLKLAGRILPMVQDQTAPVFELTGLRWPALRHLQASSVSLMDTNGVWLELRGIDAQVGLRGLINQRVVVSSLSAKEGIMARTPSSRDTETDPPKTPSQWRYEIDAIRVDRMELNEDVLSLPLEASIKAAVTYDATSGGDVTFTAAPLLVYSQSVELVSAVSWNRDAVVITQFVARTRGGTMEGAASYRFQERNASVRARTDAMDLGWLSGLAGQAAEGSVRASVDLVYSNAAVGVTWTASSDELSHSNITARGMESIGHYAWINRSHHLDESSWSIGDLMIGQQSITSITARIRTENDRLLIHLGAAVREPIEARVETDVELSLTGSTHTVIIPRFEGIAAGAPFRQTGPTTFRYGSNRWSAVINQLEWNGATLKVTAQQSRHLDIQGYVKGLNLAIIPERYRGPVQRAVFNANWNVGGWPTQTEGSVQWQINELTSISHPLSHLFPTDLRGVLDLRPDRLRLSAQTHGATNVSVLINAHAPCRWLDSTPWLTFDNESRAMVVVHAALESLASPYLPDWQYARGDLKAAFGVFGSWSDPAITGNLVVANGFFEDVIHGATVRDIRLNAGIDSIDSFRWDLSANDENSGHLYVTGTYQRAETTNYVLMAGASVTNFVFGRVFGTDLPIDGTLTLHGTGATARLTGSVESPPLSIRLPRQLPPSFRSLRVVDRNAVATVNRDTRRPRALPIDIQTDIRIRATRGVRVNGNQLRSEWQGRGQITGTIPDLRLGGSINLVRGSFMFLGRRFTVTRGEIIIPSGVRLAAPVVFITAETRASGASITLLVEGPADAPMLTLSSSPPLAKNEIVARLLFGRSGDAVSPFQIAFLAYALDILEGGGPLLQQLDKGQRTLGLDKIDIKQSEEETGLSAVVFGKRLMDRLYFEGEVGLENEPDVFAVEAELTPNLILRTETSPRIREGISINWRTDY
jgi:autotransporter translocation and assembly factor TamB